MKTSVQTTTATGALAPVLVDTGVNPFDVTAVVSSRAGCTTTTQYTLDDVSAPDFNPDTAEWLDHSDLTNVKNAANAKVGKFTSPVKAIRLNVTKIDADNVITFFVIQANT